MSSLLIADDSHAKILLMEAMLAQAQWKFPVHIAHTTHEAKQLLDTIDDLHFGLIDYSMPSERGPAVIRYFIQKHPDAQIALVSASNNPAMQQEAIEAGAESCICTSMDSKAVETAFQSLFESWNA